MSISACSQEPHVVLEICHRGAVRQVTAQVCPQVLCNHIPSWVRQSVYSQGRNLQNLNHRERGHHPAVPAQAVCNRILRPGSIIWACSGTQSSGLTPYIQMLDLRQPEYSGFRSQDWGSHFITDEAKGLAQITLSVHVPRGLLALKMSLEVTAVTPTPNVNLTPSKWGFPRAPWRLHCEPAALEDGAKSWLVLIALGPAGPPTR